MRRSHRTHQRLDEPLLLGHDPFQQKGGHVAEIKVMSAGAVKSVVSALGAEFERNAGNKLNLNFGTAGSLRERIKDGENADLVVLSEIGNRRTGEAGSRRGRHRGRPWSHGDRRGGTRRWVGPRHLDAGGVQAGSPERALGRLHRSKSGGIGRHHVFGAAGKARHC